MLRSNGARLALLLSLTFLAGSCGDDGPTAPTAPRAEERELVVLTGTWSGTFEGTLFSGDGQAQLAQTGTIVTGDWSAPMPAPLVARNAPADIDLAGPITGTATATTAVLSFGFLEALTAYFGGTDCALDVNVTSFNRTMMEATWATNDSCQPPATDEGTLTFARQ